MVNFPVDCDTPTKRTEYGYRAQELLRLLHNVMGVWYSDGISKTLYNKLPAKVQTKYPYAPKLTVAQWKDFKNLFELMTDKIASIIATQRELLKVSIAWDIKIEDFI